MYSVLVAGGLAKYVHATETCCKCQYVAAYYKVTTVYWRLVLKSNTKSEKLLRGI
jgi:hypothetical protein